ncbi:MAG: FISUMP domain-containing protein [Bacteroidales bacterium]|nr:FISUMP domain-containing protein [Bacteroidales bacterium]
MNNKNLKLSFILFLGIGFVSLKAQMPENTFTDPRDGNIYSTVTIGRQVWLAENLRFLPSVFSPLTGSQSKPYYYVYGYQGTDVQAAKNTPNYSTYGVLYNWPAAVGGEQGSEAVRGMVQGACPDGWHLPDDSEWTELIEFLQGEGHAGTECIVLKTRTGWENDGNGTDIYGFSALPAGGRYTLFDPFNGLGKNARFWSSTGASDTTSWYRTLGYLNNEVYRLDTNKELGFSVRCLKD